MIKITGLWKQKTRDGKPMLSGSVNGGVKLVILPNSFKKADKEPDFNAFFAPIERKQTAVPAPAAAPAVPPVQESADDFVPDIPW